MLKQELAQQREMAKRFLGNKAANVSSGKVKEFPGNEKVRVSGRSIAVHFPTARPWGWPLDPPPRLLIPRWVPKRAQQSIKKEWNNPFLGEDVRAALKRLATDRRMSKVWEKLPLDPDGIGLVEYCIIPTAVGALGIFPLLRSQPRLARKGWERSERKAWQRYQAHLVKYQYSPGYDWGHLAGWACDLRNEIAKLRDALAPTSDEMWSSHWRGDPAMNTTGAAISFLDALFHCFLLIGEKDRLRFADMQLPTPARWDRKAQQRFFSQVMSKELHAICGHYYDAVVDELIAVAFDLPVGPGPETVCQWRRLQPVK